MPYRAPCQDKLWEALQHAILVAEQADRHLATVAAHEPRDAAAMIAIAGAAEGAREALRARDQAVADWRRALATVPTFSDRSSRDESTTIGS